MQLEDVLEWFERARVPRQQTTRTQGVTNAYGEKHKIIDPDMKIGD